MITTIRCTCLLACLAIGAQAQKVQSFDLSDVTLLESLFYRAQQTDLAYMLEMDPDRLLAPYLIDAGIEPKAERYPNWENTGLDGHIGGHYLSALALMYAATGNVEVKERLEYMIDQLAACQQKNGNGYLGGVPGGQEIWSDIAAGRIDAQSFSLNGKWVPLYNIHKIFAGLRDACLIADQEEAKDMLIQLTDWFMGITAELSDQQIQNMLRSEHGGLNEVFADVYALTGDQKYLELARKMSHRALLDPLLQGEDNLTGLHANTQIPKVVGYQRIAQLTDQEDWNEASRFFWETVVDDRSVSIGGNSVREHFHPADDFSQMIESHQGPETCNTYNMLRLTKGLFQADPAAAYIDYYERALYNHILSSQHPDGGFVYFTPMRPRHYRVYSQPHEGFWCCVGSGLENHGKYGEMIYAHTEDDLYVNLFIPSRLHWPERGITVEQETDFPFEESTTLTINLPVSQKVVVRIRYPGWVERGKMVVRINGQKQKVRSQPGSYFVLDRKWSDGDQIQLSLPMETRAEYLPDGSNWASFVHGPIVLAAATGKEDLYGLRADDTRMGHVADGAFYPVVEAPVLLQKGKDIAGKVKPVPGKPLTFTASGLIHPETFKDLELVPFFSLHDARYILYWQVAQPEDLEQMQRAILEREEKRLALQKQTVDVVSSGEQQPESEHDYQGENTDIGSTRGNTWRQATGWFSYELESNGQGKILRINYEKQGQNRQFDILLDGQHFQSVKPDDSWNEDLLTLEYRLPQKWQDGPVKVTIRAKEGYATGRIYEVRILKE